MASAIRGSSSCSALGREPVSALRPGSSGLVPTSIKNRARSGSPLAKELRKYATAMTPTGTADLSTSVSSSPVVPQQAWAAASETESSSTTAASRQGSPNNTAGHHRDHPGHRAKDAMSTSNLTAMGNWVYDKVMEKLNHSVGELRADMKSYQRRITHMERKLDSHVEEQAREREERERWAEIMGTVNGVQEETQALARRIDVLDRLSSRISGLEQDKGKHQASETRINTLEQQSRLASAATELTHKKQVQRLLKAEHSMEEMGRRILKIEHEAIELHRGANRHDIHHRLDQFEADVQELQRQLEERALSAQEALGSQQEDVRAELEEELQEVHRLVAILEKRSSGQGAQADDLSKRLASLDVGVKSQSKRVSDLAERLEIAHEPALDALRSEFTHARGQDRREAEEHISALRGLEARMHETTAAHEEMSDRVHALHQSHSEIAALSLSPKEDPFPLLRSLEDRVEHELNEVRDRLELLMPGSPDGRPGLAEALQADLEELQQRLDSLEAQSSAAAVVPGDVAGQLRTLQAKTGRNEDRFESLQHELQELHSSIATQLENQALDSLEAKVGAMSEILDKHVTDTRVRLTQVEGGLDFARDNGSLVAASPAGSLSASLHAPRADSRDWEMRDKLVQVAEHLEAYDDLSEKVERLESRFAQLQDATLPPPLPRSAQEPIAMNARAVTLLSAEAWDASVSRIPSAEETDDASSLDAQQSHQATKNCPRCNGNGWIWDGSGYNDCPVCTAGQAYIGELRQCSGELRSMAKSEEMRCLVDMLGSLDGMPESVTTELQDGLDEVRRRLDGMEAGGTGGVDGPNSGDTTVGVSRLEKQIGELRTMVQSISEKDTVIEGFTSDLATQLVAVVERQQEMRSVLRDMSEQEAETHQALQDFKDSVWSAVDGLADRANGPATPATASRDAKSSPASKLGQVVSNATVAALKAYQDRHGSSPVSSSLNLLPESPTRVGQVVADATVAALKAYQVRHGDGLVSSGGAKAPTTAASGASRPELAGGSVARAAKSRSDRTRDGEASDEYSSDQYSSEGPPANGAESA